MKTSMRILSVAAGLALMAVAATALRPAPSDDLSAVNAEMTKAATAFWKALSPEQQQKAGFEMKDPERLNWHFIPRSRKGLPVKEMSPEQRKLADDLLATGLSEMGFKKATIIMSLEAILRELEGPNGRMVRDPELYYVSVFGQPGAAATWGWRFEGHHLSLNFTVVGGKIVLGAPSFFGSNPGMVKSGPREGLRILGEDEDLGRRIVKSLDADQKKAGIIDVKAPADVLFVPGKRPGPLEPAGIAWGALKPEQQALVWDLVQLYANRMRPEMARADLAAIEKAGKDKLNFAWAGGLEPGEGHYYRIQGPTFTIEYDNTQGNANHVHSVWHDHANNFAEDVLKKHYAEGHK
ncbi:MAG TPA: DUF3500 domain-containing protein [Planctomycetota bacterium]|nr:DUF3500 domain-containing protein [Planctomycetota bacterium]